VSHPQQNIISAVREYGKHLFNFIRGRVNTDEDAEDILQDVWFRFSHVMNIDPVEQAGAWLFRVARNRVIDTYRRKEAGSSLDEMPGEEGLNLPRKGSDPEDKQMKDYFWEQLMAALDELPAEQKAVFVWNELEEIPFSEIAERTGEKVNTLISRKRYAVLHLRKRLEFLYKEIIEQ
jgi:RNA polymerase sigma factor (sigma-70 family)